MVFEDRTFCVSESCKVSDLCDRHISNCAAPEGSFISMSDFTELCKAYRFDNAAQERKTGKWILQDETIKRGVLVLQSGYTCSECGCFSKGITNYCPNCGIRMKGENDGENNNR